jgi:transposase
MGQVVVVGLDIAKSVFQVHGVDRDGAVVVRRRLRRSRVLPFFATVEPCRIGIEACATGHYWARELGALGHDVRLMAPSYVKPYVTGSAGASAAGGCDAPGWYWMALIGSTSAAQQNTAWQACPCHLPGAGPVGNVSKSWNWFKAGAI